MNRACAALIGMSAVAVGCAPAVDLDAERTALQEADAAYTQTIADRDLEGWLSWYAPDAKVLPPNAATPMGADGLRAFGEGLFGVEGFSATFHPMELTVGSGGDLGYTLSHFVATLPGPDGEPMTDEGRDFHVWQKQADGTWKIVIDIWNSDQPVPEMMPEG